MHDSTLTTRKQTLEVDAVQAVDVTEIVDDNGTPAREVRIYGAPDGTDAPPVLTVKLTSDTEANLEVQTPKMAF